MLTFREVDMRVRWMVVLVVTALALLFVPAVASSASQAVHESHSFAVDGARRVMVDASFQDVVVTVRPGATVEVKVDMEFTGSRAERLAKEYAPRFKEVGGELRVISKRENGSWSFGGWSDRSSGTITVAMPPGLDVTIDVSSGDVHIDGDLGDAEVLCDTSSGNCEISGAMRSLSADTSSGEVRIRLTRETEEVVADTSSGNVVVEGPARTLKADTSSGDIQADGLLGDASFDTSSGDVEASWAVAPGAARVVADTSSGEVTFAFPAGTELDGLISTSSGDIRSDWNGDRNRHGDELRLEGGAGAVRLRVDTSSGDVTLRQGRATAVEAAPGH